MIQNAAYFPIIFHDRFGCCRETVSQRLIKENIYPRKYFSPLTSDSPSIKQNYIVQPTPIAQDYAGRVLTLPLYPDLDFAVIKKICAIISESSQVESNAS